MPTNLVLEQSLPDSALWTVPELRVKQKDAMEAYLTEFARVLAAPYFDIPYAADSLA